MHAENAPVGIHNHPILTILVTPLIVIKAIDKLPDNFFLSAKQLQNIQNMKLSETSNLSGVLILKIGAEIMFTSNINIDDRLVNEMIGQVAQFFISNGYVKQYI